MVRLVGVGVDSADVVGNDSGGSVAQLIVARAPQRVRTLTLTNEELRALWAADGPEEHG
jgi:pimeloyl-ACP methyl ester carboxylesterase